MIRHRSQSDSPRVRRRAFIVISGLTGMMIVGCTMTGDNLTGVKSGRAAPTTCPKGCEDLFRSLVLQEKKFRLANIEACAVLPQPERGACLVAEGQRHAAEMLRLEQVKANCLANCGRRGSG